MAGRRFGDWAFRAVRTWHGAGEKAVLPDLGPAGGVDRGADALWHIDQPDQRRGGEGGELAGATEGSQDRDRLRRPARTAALFLDATRAGRSRVRQDTGAHRQPRG